MLTLEELMALAQKEKKTKRREELNSRDTDRFILIMGLKDGKYKLDQRVAYEAYKLFANKPIKRITFLRRFTRLFFKYTEKGRHYYLVNIPAVRLINKVAKLVGV